MTINQSALKEIVNGLRGQKLTHENIAKVCMEMGFNKPPKINIGGLRQTPEGYWSNIYFGDMSERFKVDENGVVL